MMNSICKVALRLTLGFVLLNVFNNLNAQIVRNNQKYLESGTVYKLDINLSHTEVMSLLSEVTGTPVDQLDAENPGLVQISGSNQDYRIAGFCFIPIWETTAPDATNTNYLFTTTGIRVVVALWDDSFDCESKNLSTMRIAGFGGIMEAFDPLIAPNDLIANTFAIELGGILHTNANGEVTYPDRFKQNDDQLVMDTREFDFVFLEYDRYLDLATSNDYYLDNEKRDVADFGVSLERSLIRYEIGINDTTHTTRHFNSDRANYETQYVRSLTFRPHPNPKLVDANTIAAIAIEDADRCPPIWRNLSTYSPQQVLVEIGSKHQCMPDDIKKAKALDDLQEEIEVLRDENAGLQTTLSQRTTGVSFHYGTLAKSADFSGLFQQERFWEIDVEFPFRKNRNLSLRGVFGNYRFAIDGPEAEPINTFGFNALLRGYFPLRRLSSGLAGTSVYVEGGLGTYNLRSTADYGATAGGGVSVPITIRDRSFYFDTGIQYQHLNLLSNRDAPCELLAIKAGFVYYLYRSSRLNSVMTTDDR